MNRKNMMMNLGEITFFSRLIVGEYMDIDRVISMEQSIRVTLDREPMLAALERAALITEERIAGYVRAHVKLEVTEDIMKIVATSAAGSTYDELSVQHEGKDLLIALNNRYLLDVASFFGGVAAEPIVIGSNLGTIRYSTDPSQVATRIIPLGGIGYNGQRLTIRTAHGRDCIYIDRDDLVAEYGVIVRKVIHDDIACKDKSEYGTKVDELYNAGVADAQALTGKSVTWEVTAIDIARAGYPVDTFRVGWYYRIMHPILGADITLRLVEMTIDYRNPQRSKLTFGDKAATLTTSLSGATQTTQARTTAQIINVTQIIDSRMSGLDIWKGTESAYAALQTYDANTLYACYADPTP
jgi:hypothetical protein